jgi:predicted transposase YbfD/YdcC
VSHGELVAIDGKILRRSHDNVLCKKAIHIISAWSSANQVVVAQMKVDDKSNEIVPIPELLALLDLRGAVVSIDAIGCQKGIAEAIIKKKADYLLGVKGNQAGLEQQVELLFVHCKPDPPHEDITKDHSRIEMRHCDVIDNPKALASIEGWSILRSIVQDTLTTPDTLQWLRAHRGDPLLPLQCQGRRPEVRQMGEAALGGGEQGPLGAGRELPGG